MIKVQIRVLGTICGKDGWGGGWGAGSGGQGKNV